MSEDKKTSQPIERKEYKLPIDIIQGGQLKKAGGPVMLRPDQFTRISDAAKLQRGAGSTTQEA